MNYLNLLLEGNREIAFAFAVAFAYLLYHQVPAWSVVSKPYLCSVTRGVQSEGDGDFKQVICSVCGIVLEHGHICFPAFHCVI